MFLLTSCSQLQGWQQKAASSILQRGSTSAQAQLSDYDEQRQQHAPAAAEQQAVHYAAGLLSTQA
jgi:hypothetical protein